MLQIGPDHLKNNLDNQLPQGATRFSSDAANKLTDIFVKQTNSFLKNATYSNFSTMYKPVLQNILRTGSGSAITQLQAALYGNTTKPLDIKDIQDMAITLQDLILVMHHQHIAQNIPPTHDAICKDVFLDALGKVVKTLSLEQQNVYHTIITTNIQSITSLDILGKALQKFEHECLVSGCVLQKSQKDTMLNVTITCKNFLHHPSAKNIIPASESNHTSLLPGTQTTALFDSFATIFGVSTIQSLMKKADNISHQIDAMYSFVGTDMFMNAISMDEIELATSNPTFASVLQDKNTSDTDKQLAKLQAVADVLIQKNIPAAGVLKTLLDNDCDFSTLPQAQQKEYLQLVKGLWLTTEAGKDLLDYLSTFELSPGLLEAYVDAIFSPNNENIPFMAHDGKERMISIQKTPLLSNNRANNISTITLYGLPFSITLKGDCFDAKDLNELHRGNNCCKADKIPHALTLMVGATKLKQISPEEASRLVQTREQQLHQQILASELSGITTLDPTIEDTDWTDESVLLQKPIDDLIQAKRYYKKKSDDIRKYLSSLAAKEKSIEIALQSINDTLHSKTTITPTHREELEKQKKIQEEALSTILSQKEELLEIQQISKKTHELLAKTIAERQKNAHEEALSVADADEETRGTIKLLAEAVEIADPLKAMQERWNKISGEKGAPLEVGSLLCIELPDIQGSLIGWRRPWATGEIIRVEEDGTFEITWKGLDNPLVGKTPNGKPLEGSSSIVTDPSGIDIIADRVGKMWKFSKRDSWIEFGLALKKNNLDVDKEYKDHIGNFLQKVDFGSMYRRKDGVVDKSDSGNKIRYLGGNLDDLTVDEKTQQDVVKSQKVWYEVDQQKDGVRVKGKNKFGDMYEKLMSPQEFLVFIADKGLVTYTQNEVDEINASRKEAKMDTLQDEIDRSIDIPAQQKMLWTNLNAIKHCFKFGFDGIKKWLKKKQEKDSQALENMMLGSSWFKGLAKVPFFGKAFEEMAEGKDKEADQALAKEIKEAQELPEKAGDETKDGPFNFILGPGKFESVAGGGVLTDPEDVRKFAGYYLYVLSKGTQYPQTLAKYDGQGVWVRGLLGPKYQDQYISYIKRLKDIVEKNPNDGEAQKQLSLGEFGFLKKVYGDGNDTLKNRFNKIFGKTYFTKTLGSFDAEIFSNKMIGDAQEKAKGKMFSEATADYTKAIKERKFLDMYGTLKGMGENIKSDQLNYSQWMMRMAYPILAGITVNSMDAGMRKDYEMLSRQYLAPFGLFAKETDGPRKLRSLIDIVTQHAGIGESFTQRFAKYAPTSSEFRPKESQQLDFYNELNTWWFQYGNTVLETMVNEPGKLLQIKQTLQQQYDAEDDVSKKQHLLNQIMLIDGYMNKKVLDDTRDSVDVKLGGIVAEKNVINFSQGSIRQLFDYKNNSFSKELAESGPKAWNALTKQIKGYANASQKASPDLYKFVLKKFITFFDNQCNFASTNANSLMAALKYAHKPDAMTIFIMNKIDPNDKAPKEVKDAIEAFQNFLKTQKPSDDELKKILEVVLGKGAGEDYESLEADKVKKSTKKEKDQKESQLINDIMAEKGINQLIDGSEKYAICRDDRSGVYRLYPGGNIVKPVQSKKKGGPIGGKIKMEFNVFDDQGNLIKKLPCYDFRENQLASYQKIAALGGYDDQFGDNGSRFQ